MAGEDVVLRILDGMPTTSTIEDNTYTYAIDVGTVSVGDVVYQVSGTDSKVARADADNASARPPIGVCLSLPTTTTAVIVHSGGTVTGMTGLTRGTAYWLSTTAGALTDTKPGSNAYIIGVALSSTALLVCCVPADLTSAAGATSLDDLTDVDAPSPADGDVLTYDSGSGDWIAAAPSGGGGTIFGGGASGAVNTVPVAADFPTTVLGGGSTTDTTSALVLKANGHGSSYDVQQILQTAPSAPWVRYFKMEVNPSQKAYLIGSFIIKQSSTGKMVQWDLISTGTYLALEYDELNSATSRSGFLGLGGVDPTGAYFKIEDDNTNFIFSASPTGIENTYVAIHTVSRTAFLASYDLIGFGADAQNLSIPNNDLYVIIEHYSADPPSFVAGSQFSTMWNPKVPPESPNAKDDEFDDGLVDTAKWTEWDHGSKLTPTEDSYGLKLVQAQSGGSNSRAGLLQAIPSDTEFYFLTRSQQSGQGLNFFTSGLILTDGTGSGVNWTEFYLRGATAGQTGDVVEWGSGTGYTGSVTTNGNATVYTNGIYLLLQVKPSTSKAQAWHSHDGIGWYRLGSEVTLSYTPTHFGVFTNNLQTSGPDLTARFEMFRVYGASSGIMGVNPDPIGARVAVSNGPGGYQPLDTDLSAYAALTTTGLVARTGSGAAAARTLTGPAAGITVSNGNGVSGNPTLALANDLSALEGLSGTGLAARTAADTWAQRSIAVPAAGLTITNGDGVAGNPTLALANDLAAVEGLTSTGIVRRTATDTWSAGTTVSIAEGGTGETTADAARLALDAIDIGLSYGVAAGEYY